MNTELAIATMDSPQSSNYLEGLYLEYFNNFLTVDRFAEYYGLDVTIANEVIFLGRVINNSFAEGETV